MHTDPPGTSTYDLVAFLRGLDALFAAHDGTTRAEPFLLAALAEAETLADEGAVLSILNEVIGFYRSQSRHDEATATGVRALSLVARMGLAGTDAHATTLINAATAMRAAGRPDDALPLYHQALDVSRTTMAPDDRRLAALHNNLSIVFSDLQDQPQAAAELEAALAVLERSSPDPTRDVEIATTCSNLALVCFSLGLGTEAAALVDRSLAIFDRADLAQDAHHAAAVAAHAEACFRMGRPSDAAALYGTALAIIAACYGTANDYYAITAANLAQAQAQAHDAADAARPAVPPRPRPAASPAPALSGLALARDYWEAWGEPLLARYPRHRGRIAVGLVGHGSECYGFDDALSRDHDFGPGFCLWLTPEDHAAIGADLQADYDTLPREHQGVRARRASPQATGGRVGVFEIGDFFAGLTGYRQAPAADRGHEWLLLEEATLATATNGVVFADPHGAFGAARAGFVRMPDDVRLALVSRRLGLIAQTGQYNVPRMLERGDGEAAWLSVAEFTRAVASVVFLLNGPASAGYLPYYKWQFAALRRLSGRMGSRLPGVCADLSLLLRLAGAACFGGETSARAGDEVNEVIERICRQVIGELKTLGLTRGDDPYLEHHRPFVQACIRDPWLRSV